MSAAVEFRDISKSYGRRAVVRSLNMTIDSGTFTVIFGAPACGKSTLLRLLTGLEKPDSGTICLRGQDVTRVAPGQRNIGYVPQSFALYPHYSVADNIGYPLRLLGYGKRDITSVVQRAAALLKIEHLLAKKPDQCSGGEKQRVAIARGIVKNTNIFVLDDPLTGLDFKLREQLFDDLREMKENLNATFVYTTSDALEALMLGEQVRVIDGGTLIEAGEMASVYARPQNVRTMALLGFPEANVLPGSLNRDRCETPLFRFPIHLEKADSPSNVKIGVRPQDVKINPPAGDSLLTRDAEITLVEDLGGELVVYLNVDGLELTAVARHSEAVEEGRARIGIHPRQMLIYDAHSGHRIGEGAA